jgi:hypothetical protein
MVPDESDGRTLYFEGGSWALRSILRADRLENPRAKHVQIEKQEDEILNPIKVQLIAVMIS